VMTEAIPEEAKQGPVGRLERLPTNCKVLDTLTDGGLATGTITQVFGEKALGKSILSLQAALSAVSSGHSALVLDTEQSYFSYLAPYWVPRLSQKLGQDFDLKNLKLEKVPKRASSGGRGDKKREPATRSQVVTTLSNALNQLGITYSESEVGSMADLVCPEFQLQLDDVKGPAAMVIQQPDVIDLLSLHGVVAEKEVSEGGRVTLRLKRTPVYDSVLRQVIKETKVKLLIYDSISAPFKSTFPNTQDLPARSAGMAMILSHAQRLCVEFGIAVVVVSHVSIDPMHEWDRRPYGGVMLGHEAKFSFELTKGTSKRNKEAEEINPEEADDDNKELRRIWVQRHPAMGEYAKFGYARVDGEGFH
jgi:RecA/RadA recombinase